MSNIVISIITATKTHVTTAKGGYDKLDLVYKIKLGSQEKVEAKAVMSFTMNPASFNVLANSSMGDVFTITRQKNDKGYWDWKEAKEGVQDSGSTDTPADSNGTAAKAPAGTDAKRSAFETPEERDFRQTMIVRQYCLAQAVNYCKDDTEPSVSTVLEIAEQFEQWVIRK